MNKHNVDTDLESRVQLIISMLVRGLIECDLSMVVTNEGDMVFTDQDTGISACVEKQDIIDYYMSILHGGDM